MQSTFQLCTPETERERRKFGDKGEGKRPQRRRSAEAAGCTSKRGSFAQRMSEWVREAGGVLQCCRLVASQQLRVEGNKREREKLQRLSLLSLFPSDRQQQRRTPRRGARWKRGSFLLFVFGKTTFFLSFGGAVLLKEPSLAQSLSSIHNIHVDVSLVQESLPRGWLLRTPPHHTHTRYYEKEAFSRPVESPSCASTDTMWQAVSLGRLLAEKKRNIYLWKCEWYAAAALSYRVAVDWRPDLLGRESDLCFYLFARRRHQISSRKRKKERANTIALLKLISPARKQNESDVKGEAIFSTRKTLFLHHASIGLSAVLFAGVQGMLKCQVR